MTKFSTFFEHYAYKSVPQGIVLMMMMMIIIIIIIIITIIIIIMIITIIIIIEVHDVVSCSTLKISSV